MSPELVRTFANAIGSSPLYRFELVRGISKQCVCSIPLAQRIEMPRNVEDPPIEVKFQRFVTQPGVPYRGATMKPGQTALKTLDTRVTRLEFKGDVAVIHISDIAFPPDCGPNNWTMTIFFDPATSLSPISLQPSSLKL